MAAFALRRRLSSPRIVKTIDYGSRWRGHIVGVQSDDDLDNELRTWLQEAHDTVGLQDDLDSAAHTYRLRPTGARQHIGTRKNQGQRAGG